MRVGPVLGVLASAFILLSGEAVAGDGSDGRLTWSAFECGTYAGYAGNTAEQERLFNLGVAAGRRFITALQAGEFDEEDLRDVPIGLTLSLGGPSVDFMLGNVFATASGHAFDRIQDDMAGSSDENLRRLFASTRFQNANCALLR